MTKVKFGDKIRGKVYGSFKYVTGNVISTDKYDSEATYLVETPDGSVWLETSTVELVKEKDSSKYDQLLNFVNENKISSATVKAVITHLDKIEQLDCDIENTKKLCEQNKREIKRLYDKVYKLEKERSELLK